MTAATTETDPHDPRVARGATGLLRIFNEAGVLDSSDVHVARRVCALGEEEDEEVALAVAFVVRAVRGGSVCVDLATVRDTEPDLDELPWPEPGAPAALRLQEWAAMPWPLVAAGLLVLLFLCLLRLGTETSDALTDDAETDDAETDSAGMDDEAGDVGAGDVEQIEAAERPEPAPRVPHLSSDGSTANGYDEYFRRR